MQLSNRLHRNLNTNGLLITQISGSAPQGWIKGTAGLQRHPSSGWAMRSAGGITHQEAKLLDSVFKGTFQIPEGHNK